MFALVDNRNNRVIEIKRDEENLFETTPDFTWIPVPQTFENKVVHGWTFNFGTFYSPEDAMTFEEVKEITLQIVYSKAFEQLGKPFEYAEYFYDWGALSDMNSKLILAQEGYIEELTWQPKDKEGKRVLQTFVIEDFKKIVYSMLALKEQCSINFLKLKDTLNTFKEKHELKTFEKTLLAELQEDPQ
jgi:hypothetical protein